MSVRVMAQVWENSRHGGTQLLMLLSIADFADDAGRAYPSVATLAAKCRVKQRAANYVLRELQASGELAVQAGRGPRGTNVYRIAVERFGVQPGAGVQGVAEVQSVAGVQGAAPLQKDAGTPAKACALPLHPVADKPSMNHHESPKYKTRARKAPAVDVDLADLRSGVAEQVWQDWVALRAKKKAPITRTAVAAIAAEAVKAGLSLEEVLTMSCTRGWAGFEAAWVRRDDRTTKPASKHNGFEKFNYREGINHDGSFA